jgi:hypothetical protein
VKNNREFLGFTGRIQGRIFMSRRRTGAELEEMARIARAREAARRQATIDANRPYRPRGDQTAAFYRSMLRVDGTDRIVYGVSIDAETVGAGGLLTLADAGLMAGSSGTGNIYAGSIKGSGVRPTRVAWYYGDATPTVVRTSWGSRWIKKYDISTGNQSHRSTPFSEVTGDIDVTTLKTRFLTLFGPTGSKRTSALGEKGKATLTFERGSIFS